MTRTPEQIADEMREAQNVWRKGLAGGYDEPDRPYVEDADWRVKNYPDNWQEM